jgi:hypothetical protein
MTCGALLIALWQPVTAPYLLLTASAIQDAPGQAGLWWYASAILLGTVVIFNELPAMLRFLQTRDGRLVKLALVSGLALVAYAAAASFIYDSTEIYPQSDDRQYGVVSAAMIFMMTAGVATALNLARRGWDGGPLKFSILFLLAHALMAIVLQMQIGPAFLASEAGREVIADAAQLNQATDLGFARVHGTYLTPNGFALAYVLLLLVLAVRRQTEPVSLRAFVVFATASIGLSAVALSKSMLSFSVLTSLVMALQVYGHRAKNSLMARIAILAGVVSAVSIVIFALLNNQELLAHAFRFAPEEATESSYRALAWSLVVEKFDWTAWVFGTGLSHWQVLFDSELPFRLSDPHSYLLSIPGTFGVLGVLLFSALIAVLARVAIKSRGSRRVLAISLLILFLVKDLVSIPYILGNTPITLLIWVLLTMVLSPEITAVASVAAEPMPAAPHVQRLAESGI